MSKRQKIMAIFLSADIDAFPAEYAAKWVIGEKSEVDLFVNFSFDEF